MNIPKYIICFILISNINLALANCSVSAQQLSFGNYQPFNNSDHDAQSNIYISCGNSFNKNNMLRNLDKIPLKNTRVTIKLSTGQSGTYTSRELHSGSNRLYYNIYTNKHRTQIWGDSTGGSSVVNKNIGKKTKVISIYGRIPNSQSIPPGIYTDNIIVEINF